MKSAYLVIVSTVMVAACTPPFPGTITELGTSDPNIRSSGAFDVSDTGRIVGYVYAPELKAAEFEASGGVLQMPTPSGYWDCWAVAVANDGRIAGNCNRRGNQFFTRRDTAFFAASVLAPPVLLTPEDGVLSSVVDMNERGVILGVENTLGAEDATYWIYDTATAKFTELPGLPNKQMSAVAINDVGDIVGKAGAPSSDGNSYVWEGVKWSGSALTLTTLPLVPSDINNRGDIIGDNLYLPAGSAVPQNLPAPVLDPGDRLERVLATDLNDEGFVIGVAHYFSSGSDVGAQLGLAWTPERHLIKLPITPHAVNASRVIVGGSKVVRIELSAP